MKVRGELRAHFNESSCARAARVQSDGNLVVYSDDYCHENAYPKLRARLFARGEKHAACEPIDATSGNENFRRSFDRCARDGAPCAVDTSKCDDIPWAFCDLMMMERAT